MRSALFLSIVLATTATTAWAEDVSALLKRQTQEFSDAGQIGDTKVLDRYLDPKVVFFNEGGDQATKKDMIAPGPPPPKGVSVKMTVTDWHVEQHGDVAVASFIDDQQMNFHGQPVHAQYRSVETWLKEGSDWKMVGSETIALQQDPPVIVLAAAQLDQYAGTYTAGPGAVIVLSRKGGDLYSSANGGAPVLQKVELPGVLFTPGTPRVRKIFERDAHGRIIGFASRREGHDIVFRRIG
jgi:ketosteroid isomerase-like protein